ncbi:hypothetical protein EMIT0P176_190043 [Pseudomonas sp. IT-P176]
MNSFQEMPVSRAVIWGFGRLPCSKGREINRWVVLASSENPSMFLHIPFNLPTCMAGIRWR